MTITALTRPSRATARRGRLLVLVVPQRHQVTVLVAGDLDGDTAPQLRDGLTRSLFYRPRSVLVDAADVSFCDLRGLDALADGIDVVERSGARVVLEPSAQLVWLCSTLAALPGASGQPGPDPAGCLLRPPA